MRDWRPAKDEAADLLPPEYQLPDPPWEYHELETMQAFGCWHLAAWRSQSADDRAQLMAHERHKALRASWQAVHARKAAEPKKPLSQAPWDVIQRQFMGGG